jgi:2-polyprenyl-3-methyl-5-hydroxy-6-metoxy-1,4-benzoquinol methylase
MSCKQCAGIELHFDQKYVAKEHQQYRDDGPTKETQLLIDALVAEGVSEMTVLDIGGGVGVIQHELLKRGVSSCIDVEASTVYIEAAKKEAERQGHAESITHLHGDFVDLAAELPECDIVTLDRVICCYHDVVGLVEKSAKLAKSMYGVIYPRNNLSTKIGGFFENMTYRIHRSQFRFFVHPTKVVEEILLDQGFERRSYREMGMWQIVVFRRVSS